jgi:hypothetical protein
MPYPKMLRIKQLFETAPPLIDIPMTVRQTLERLRLSSEIKPGETVAITAGSRGIANITVITKMVVEKLKAIGAVPFVVPAMGSHGGATSDGQLEILRQHGITEEAVGAPIRSSMEVVQIGETLGFPVYLDKTAWEADHIALVVRIKPHTDFKAEIESGFCKMMAVGLGKHKGAAACHHAFVRHGYQKVLENVGREVLKTSKVAFGVGILENAYEQTARVEAVLPSEMEQKDRHLLSQAKRWMMKLPFDQIDVLIVDEMGKNVSGDGMDTNVIGRFIQASDAASGPRIDKIVALDLTEESRGNAVGIGRADFATKRLVEKIDRHATYVNALTFLDPGSAKIPPYFDTDREAIDAALISVGMIEAGTPKLVRIKNTLDLSEAEVSDAYVPLLKKRNDLLQLSDPEELQFGQDGNLLPLKPRKNEVVASNYVPDRIVTWSARIRGA